MKIVIDIPEEKYNEIEPFLNVETIKGGFNMFRVLEIIKNGTPLPKGHGDLIDRNSILCRDFPCDLCSHTYECFRVLAPTIIEADTEESEDKLDGDPVDIDKAVEHYEKTLETLKGIDLEVDG